MNPFVLGIFALGVYIGLKNEKWLPPLQKKVERLADKAKDAYWEKKERFADVVAELKEEQAEEQEEDAKAPRYDA